MAEDRAILAFLGSYSELVTDHTLTLREILLPYLRELGFNKGIYLPDPDHLLEGTGKISRYVVITSAQQIQSSAIKKLIEAALGAYKERCLSIH